MKTSSAKTSPSTAQQIPRSVKRPAPERVLSPAEVAALATVAASAVGFAVYGVATSAPSTAAYVLTVLGVGALLLALRRTAVPSGLALALAFLAVAHLAGGLVRIGDGVLYNASPGSAVLRYDHLVHASGVFLGTLVVWTLFAPLGLDARGRRAALAVWVLSGLGMGAANETIEFLATLAHRGTHIGGYTNTGWDLVSNVIGAAAAALVITRSAATSARAVGGAAERLRTPA